jgi:hypothetical protein
MTDFNFKKISTLNISAYSDTVKSFTKEDWNRFTDRQNTWEVHQHTKTIPLLFDIDNMTKKIEDIKSVTARLHYPKFKFLLEEISDICRDVYGNGYLLRAILTSLKSKCSIAKHKDESDNLEKCKRLHMAILTDPECIFIVGDEAKYMRPGEMWEINNAGKEHSVHNKSNIDRVHLITDWVLYD